MVMKGCRMGSLCRNHVKNSQHRMGSLCRNHVKNSQHLRLTKFFPMNLSEMGQICVGGFNGLSLFSSFLYRYCMHFSR
jgi:hypothetical protein